MATATSSGSTHRPSTLLTSPLFSLSSDEYQRYSNHHVPHPDHPLHAPLTSPLHDYDYANTDTTMDSDDCDALSSSAQSSSGDLDEYSPPLFPRTRASAPLLPQVTTHHQPRPPLPPKHHQQQQHQPSSYIYANTALVPTDCIAIKNAITEIIWVHGQYPPPHLMQRCAALPYELQCQMDAEFFLRMEQRLTAYTNMTSTSILSTSGSSSVVDRMSLSRSPTVALAVRARLIHRAFMTDPDRLATHFDCQLTPAPGVSLDGDISHLKVVHVSQNLGLRDGQVGAVMVMYRQYCHAVKEVSHEIARSLAARGMNESIQQHPHIHLRTSSDNNNNNIKSKSVDNIKRTKNVKNVGASAIAVDEEVTSAPSATSTAEGEVPEIIVSVACTLPCPPPASLSISCTSAAGAGGGASSYTGEKKNVEVAATLIVSGAARRKLALAYVALHRGVMDQLDWVQSAIIMCTFAPGFMDVRQFCQIILGECRCHLCQHCEFSLV